MLLLLTSLAQAAYVVDVGAPIDLGRNATWVRAFPKDDGNWFIYIGAGGGAYAIFDDDLQMVQDFTLLTNMNNMQDHGVARCPDGGFLQVSSYTTDSHNDSARTWRYDGDWNLISEAVLFESEKGILANDMGIVCGETFKGPAFRKEGGGGGSAGWFYPLDRDSNVGDRQEIPSTPNITGSALQEIDGELVVWGTPGFRGDSFVAATYDSDFAKLSTSDEVRPGTPEIWWTQGVLKAGDLTLVAYMGKDAGETFPSDTGNVYLTVLDADLSVLETRKITTYSDSEEGAMRPGLARRGDTAIVTWDKDVKSWASVVELDLSGAGQFDSGEFETGDPSGGDDTAPGGGDDSGGGGGVGCAVAGCSTGAGMGLWAFGLAVALLRRRRRD